MVSKIFSLAAFAGMAMAQTYSNISIVAPGTKVNTTAPASPSFTPIGPIGGSPSNASTLTGENAFCRAFSGNAGIGYSLGAFIYSIECGLAFEGFEIEIDISVTITKRDVVATNGLPGCIAYCNELTAAATAAGNPDGTCVATSFSRDTFECTFYHTVTGSAVDASVDSALVVDAAGAGAGAGGAVGAVGTAIPLTTSVVPASTTTYTIYSCAATVTDCPLRQVATSVVAAYTTVCPAAAATSGVPAPVACSSCPYVAKVVTVYSASSSSAGGSTTYVPVETKVINVPSVTGTTGATGVALTTAVAATGTGAYTTSPAAFTGAAQHVEAGMGMVALIGAAALLI